MKSVLISIRPEWCEKIASGKKTLEIRKTRPRIETPFKCYIYCTKNGCYMEQSKTNPAKWTNRINKYGGKVIGEFVCDKILYPFSLYYSEKCKPLDKVYFRTTCLTDKQIIDYLGNGKSGYAWHISDLVIYDKPKELDEFCFPPDKYCEKELCGGCPYDESPNQYGEYQYDCEWQRPIQRPPQSWCYVEARY